MEILRRWWHARRLLAVLAGIVAGLAMIGLPLKTSLDNDAWGEQLRAEGVPVQGTVSELEYGARNSTTMHLRYDLAGVRHWAEVGCWQVCHPAGTAVRIWVSPHDPADFVTDYGVLSGHRGRIQGGIGVIGLILFVGMMILVVTRLIALRRDRRRERWKAEQHEERRLRAKPARLRRRKT